MQLEELLHNKQFLDIIKKMLFKQSMGIKSMQYAEVRKHEVYMWQNFIAVNKNGDPKMYMEIEKFTKKHGIILM